MHSWGVRLSSFGATAAVNPKAARTRWKPDRIPAARVVPDTPLYEASGATSALHAASTAYTHARPQLRAVSLSVSLTTLSLLPHVEQR